MHNSFSLLWARCRSAGMTSPRHRRPPCRLVSICGLLSHRVTLRQVSNGRFQPYAALVQVTQEIRRIVVGAIGAGPFQFVLSIAARQEPDAERGGATGR